MKDYKEYFRKKSENTLGIIGQNTVTPPETTDVLQSSSTLGVMDLISEGPIEGLMTSFDKKAEGIRTLEGLYINKTPAKEPEEVSYSTKNAKLLPFSKIKTIGRCNREVMNQIFDNITGRLMGDDVNKFVLNNGLFVEKRQNNTPTFERNSANGFPYGSTRAYNWDGTQSWWADRDFTREQGITVSHFLKDNTDRPFNNNMAVRFLGLYKANADGTVKFKLTSDDFSAFWWNKTPHAGARSNDNVQIISGHFMNNPSANADLTDHVGVATQTFTTPALEAGKVYPFVVCAMDGGVGNCSVKLEFASADGAGGHNAFTTNGAGYYYHYGDSLTPTSKDQRFLTNIYNQTGSNALFNEYGQANFASGIEGSIAKVAEVKAIKDEFLDFVETNSGISRFGVIEYDVSGVFGTSDLISGRQIKRGFQTALTTAFDFDIFMEQPQHTEDSFNGTVAARQFKDVNGKILSIPEHMHFSVPVFNPSVVGTLGDSRKVEAMQRVDNFIGGGMFFFDAGTGEGTNYDAVDGFHLHTGRFMVSSSTNFRDEIEAGLTDGHDVFVYNTSGLHLASATPTQTTPVRGTSNKSTLKLGYRSDLQSRYNYSNVAFSYRKGYEQQPVIDGYEKGSLDIESRHNLYGPLVYRPGAQAGTGYRDTRSAGDFSAWMTNPPLEYDAYIYTHIVRREEVDHCFPTITINRLFDTIEDGDRVGKRIAHSVNIGVTNGFEGDVGDPNDNSEAYIRSLLEAGNHPRSIALKNFQTTISKQYTSIVTNAYLNTIDDIKVLPKNIQLKDLKMNSDSVPGLTTTLINEFGFVEDEPLFPGESWRKLNRYVKVQKLTFETDSSLIERDVAISYFTETIDEGFTYPLSAIAGTTFDARTFAKQPPREYDIRGKKVLIPSNYEPLNSDGSDKRFIASREDYGKRKILNFNGSVYGKVNKKIDLGKENVRFEVKVNRVAEYNERNTIVSMRANGQPQSSVDLFTFAEGLRMTVTNAAGGSTSIFSNTTSNVSTPAATVYEIKYTLLGEKMGLFARTTSLANLTAENYTFDRPVGSAADVMAAPNGRGSIVFDPDASNGGTHLLIGNNASEDDPFTDGGQFADLKLYKNDQLIHHWDGTVFYSEIDEAMVLRDVVGGAHAELVGTLPDPLVSENVRYGKGKELVYNGEWDGKLKLGWTDNPAWILYDLMINPVYGIGNRLDDRDDINIFRLYTLGRFCDAVDQDGGYDGVPDSNLGLEPRFSCNIRLHQAKNAYETLSNIGSVFRAISFWDGAFLNFTVDKDKPVQAIFNNQNVLDGTFAYSDIASTARFNRVEVPYADAADQFTIKFEYVEDEESIRNLGIINTKINGIGCTSKSQARRLGKYMLLSNKMETELVVFKSTDEALLLEPGDPFAVQDDLKNFEMGYGRITSVYAGFNPFDEGTRDFARFGAAHVMVDNTDVDINSVVTGGKFTTAGNLYCYNTNPQTEFKNLYDIANFEQTYELEPDRADFIISQGNLVTQQDVFSGVMTEQLISGSDRPQVTKFPIRTISGTSSGIKIDIDVASMLNQTNPLQPLFSNPDTLVNTITGVPVGTYCNFELYDRPVKEYKVVKIIPEEDGYYTIHGLEYDRRKFDMIESEDFDVEETNYEIGTPLHIVQRPSPPTFANGEPVIFQTPTLFYAITGSLTKAAGSDERAYRVTILKTNRSAPYLQKEFLKEEDDNTFFRMDGLIDGDYTLRVNSLRNPESSSSLYYDFKIKTPQIHYTQSLFEEILADVNITSKREGSNLYVTNQSLDTSAVYDLKPVNEYKESLQLKHVDYSVNIYVKEGENYTLIKEDHKENQFTFTEVKNRLTFGELNNEFELKFELLKEGQVIDNCFCKTTIV